MKLLWGVSGRELDFYREYQVGGGSFNWEFQVAEGASLGSVR